MQRVTRIFRWAAGDGNLLPGAIAESLERIEHLKIGRTVAVETDAVEPVSDAAVELTLQHLPQILGDMVRVQRLIGCRLGGVCQLRTPGDTTFFRGGADFASNRCRHCLKLRGRNSSPPTKVSCPHVLE